MEKPEKPPILAHKYYNEYSVFHPENLLREARRQKNLPECSIPEICVLDPDGDLVRYLKSKDQAVKNDCWACYHSELYNCEIGGRQTGIIPCAVGASYAVIVAEQLFVSGCQLLISVTSAGSVSEESVPERFAVITEAIRDEGTSYHYLPPDRPSQLSGDLLDRLRSVTNRDNAPFFEAKSWTTDAPYRETAPAIEAMKKKQTICVEMEAAALYAYAERTQNDVICFAHLTNNMARQEGDFEKGEEFGSPDTMNLISKTLDMLNIP